MKVVKKKGRTEAFKAYRSEGSAGGYHRCRLSVEEKQAILDEVFNNINKKLDQKEVEDYIANFREYFGMS